MILACNKKPLGGITDVSYCIIKTKSSDLFEPKIGVNKKSASPRTCSTSPDHIRAKLTPAIRCVTTS
jgi:hypothetical protein